METGDLFCPAYGSVSAGQQVCREMMWRSSHHLRGQDIVAVIEMWYEPSDSTVSCFSIWLQICRRGSSITVWCVSVCASTESSCTTTAAWRSWRFVRRLTVKSTRKTLTRCYCFGEFCRCRTWCRRLTRRSAVDFPTPSALPSYSLVLRELWNLLWQFYTRPTMAHEAGIWVRAYRFT